MEKIPGEVRTQPEVPLEMPAERPPGSQPREQGLAFHETMEIHELLNFQTVSMVKSKFASGVVFDQDLKALLEKNVRQSMEAVKQLEIIYRNRAELQ